MPNTQPTIWIDGDGVPTACKEVIFKSSLRTKVPVMLIANRFQQVPRLRSIQFQQVHGGLDVADDYIADHCRAGDLVVTSDIPLAARAVEAGALVLRFRGELLDQENVRQRLAVRDRMDALRGAGIATGGPAAYGPKDKQRFANALDRWLARRFP